MVDLTTKQYSPWDQLPAEIPKEIDYPDGYFYNNTAKYLIKDTERIMNNGLTLHMERIKELEDIIVNQLNEIKDQAKQNKYIKKYLDRVAEKKLKDKKEQILSKKKQPEELVTEFKPKNIVHRSYFMKVFCNEFKIFDTPNDKVHPEVPKWTANQVKKYVDVYPILKQLLEGTLQESNRFVKQAMLLMAAHKAEILNKKYEQQIKDLKIEDISFNFGSSVQKRELFHMLGIESPDKSKTTGEDSFNRDVIEEIHGSTNDEILKEITKLAIDYSFANIIKTTFIPAFYKYSVNGVLYGTYTLLGAKSARYTSKSPNMLNAPSSGRFAKPVKRCFIAQEDFIVATIDFSALEDRVIANLSGDLNKISIFLEGIDGHSLATCYYWTDKVKEVVGDFTEIKEGAKLLKKAVDSGNNKAKELRRNSKPITFGLAYGCFPPKVASTIKCSLEEAKAVFDAYHNEMYPGVSKYREEYVLPTAKANGELHLGLGFYIKTDNAEKDIRTLNNASVQFWSILSILGINKLHALIDEAGLQDDIFVTSTIYDSIYFEVRKDPEIIKWLNDRIVPILEKDFIKGQIVPNEARLEIGDSWADLTELSKNATIKEITEVLKKYED